MKDAHTLYADRKAWRYEHEHRPKYRNRRTMRRLERDMRRLEVL